MSDRDRDSFYRSALTGLAVLEARSGVPRRFGPDADARWRAFRGALGDWDRIEILVRDAAVTNPAGFSPRVVFRLLALADDEPCGPEWPGPDPATAAELLRSVAAFTAGLTPALQQVARTWGLELAPPPAPSLGEIQPATHLVAMGAGAVLALAEVFADRRELDLADQVVLMADDPGTRQMFGLAVAFLQSRRPVRILPLATSAVELRAIFPRVDRAVVSDDVTAAAREAALALARDLGLRGCG